MATLPHFEIWDLRLLYKLERSMSFANVERTRAKVCRSDAKTSGPARGVRADLMPVIVLAPVADRGESRLPLLAGSVRGAAQRHIAASNAVKSDWLTADRLVAKLGRWRHHRG